MNNGAGLAEYLNSLYLVEVIVALVLGLLLVPVLRRGSRVDRPPTNAWRKFLVIFGWLSTAGAIVTWLAVLLITVIAWIDSVNPDIPKKPSLLFLVLGGFLYLVLLGFAENAFRGSSGTARSDIMQKIGRPED